MRRAEETTNNRDGWRCVLCPYQGRTNLTFLSVHSLRPNVLPVRSRLRWGGGGGDGACCGADDDHVFWE
jgi:hypothetical protein